MRLCLTAEQVIDIVRVHPMDKAPFEHTPKKL